MKKRFLSLFSLLCLSPTLLFAAPKIATLDLGKVIQGYDLNSADVAKYKEAKETLEKDPRKAAVIEMAKKLQDLQKEIQGVSPESEEHAKIVEEGNASKAAYDDILNEWTQYRTAKLRAITETLVTATSKRTDEILLVSRAIADSEGYDWVLETNGKTSSRMPVVLYVRNATDLTEQIIAKVNKDYPATKTAEVAE